MMLLSLFLVAAVPHLSHAAPRTEERDGFASVKMRFLEDNSEGDDFSDAMYDPCYPCGPSGFTTTPDIALPEFGQQGNGEDFTCSYLYDGFVAGMVPAEECAPASMFFNEFCGCAANPTVSPAPTISFEPTLGPSSSPSPTVAVCYLCGTSDYVEIDYYATVNLGGTSSSYYGEFPCDILNDPEFLEYFLMDETDLSCPDIQALGKDCGCPPLEPTISPAPTISAPPTSSPSTSPAPTTGPCFLCGPENPWADIDYDKSVNVSALGGLTPCYVLHDFAYWGLDGGYYFGTDDDGFESSPSYNLTCIDVQAYGKECGCPPTEPTISPGPTVSAPPSTTPSTSMAPTASPCFLCGDESPFAEIDYEKEVNVPALGGPIPCVILQDMAYYLGFETEFFYYNVTGGDELTCSDVQSYARECGCPMTEPTASPYPTISAPPSSTPSVSPAPTAPCSCESHCDGYNSDCDCWCDFVCESYGDCCGDVKDFCDFEGYEEGFEGQVEIDFDTLNQEGDAPVAPAPVSPPPAPVP